MRRLTRSNTKTAVLLALSVAILIWAKLRLVTAIPRTVYADDAAEHAGAATPRAKGDAGINGVSGTGANGDADVAPANTR